MRAPALGRFHFLVEFDPIKAAVGGIGVDSRDPAREPAATLPELRVEIRFDPVADLNFGFGIRHHRYRFNSQGMRSYEMR